MQWRCGTKNLWELISFTGKFDSSYLAQKLKDAPTCSSNTGKQQLVKIASEARNKLRLAKKHDSKRSRIIEGTDETLTAKEQQLLRLYDSDKLRVEANKATVASGHGRLKGRSGQFVDIGGSTGGGTRRALDNYIPPNPDEIKKI